MKFFKKKKQQKARSSNSHRALEIFLAWILLAFMLKERYKAESALRKQELCHGALNSQSRNLTVNAVKVISVSPKL